MTTTPRYALPFLFPAQAQKEHFHNEALVVVDAALHPVVEQGARTDPPVEPGIGQCWIVAADAIGAWAGRGDAIACWTGGGWRFVAPVLGMLAWDAEAGHYLTFGSAGWSGVISVSEISIAGQSVIRERQPALATPSGGTTIDVEARAAVDQIIATLKTHGLTN